MADLLLNESYFMKRMENVMHPPHLFLITETEQGILFFSEIPEGEDCRIFIRIHEEG